MTARMGCNLRLVKAARQPADHRPQHVRLGQPGMRRAAPSSWLKFARGLASKIDGRNRLATVPHLAADYLPRLAIERLLLRRELLRRRAATRRALRAGQFLVALLGVEMAMPVETMNTDPRAFGAKVLQIVAVGGVAGRDEALALGERFGLIDELPLLQGAN